MRRKFDEQLMALNKKIIEMGALCEEVISLISNALIHGDTSVATKVSPLDSEIDAMESEVESMCLKLLLQQQPVAGDFRQVSAALKMITDMERIGDQAEDIAEIVTYINGRTGSECAMIGNMSNAIIKMVTESVEAFVKKDVKLAETVIKYDDVVDECFVKVKSELIGLIAQNPQEGEYALDLLMIAKYFERIGDHATNIAEWVVFSVTGVHNREE